MSFDTRIVLNAICFIFAFALVGVGFLMRKFDLSGMLNHPWKKTDGLYIRKGLRLKKVAEDTPKIHMPPFYPFAATNQRPFSSHR